MSARVQIWDIHGGIHPPECKELSSTTPIQPGPLPGRLVLPLNQHIGSPAELLVQVGDRVLKGQKLAETASFVSSALHAPTSGRITAIGPQPYPHDSGLPEVAITIEADGLDQWCELSPCADFRAETPAALLEMIRDAGVNGLGGAGFPTDVKLTLRPHQKIHTLILNGAECEPYITADDLLMRERAAELVSGIDILVHIIQPDSVLIGIEDNKPQAIAAVRAAIGSRPYEVRVVPTKYPSGAAKQLIQILTGREVPSGDRSADIGVLCQNVGTAVAVHDAVVLGRPLISRITTLTGAALARPGNVEALIGTPVRDLLEFAGLDNGRLQRLIMGGPMMGVTLPSLDVPLIKTTNCLLAATADELPPNDPAMPCIRCGECALVCPSSLLPQQLHFFSLGSEHDQLRAHNLFDCIECGCCSFVCPSGIPLVQYYRASKAEIREHERKQQKAEHARQRFELRQQRVEQEEQRKEAERRERAEKAARAQAAAASKPAAAAETAAPASDAAAIEQQKKLKIELSMAQVALKKAEKQLAQHDTPELQAQVAELRASLARAQAALEAATPATAPATAAATAAPAVDNAAADALKKAKIELSMKKVALKKAEKAEAPAEEIGKLKAELAAAEQQLAALEQQSAAPAPAAAQAPAAAPVEDAAAAALKKAKIELSMKKVAIRKAEKAEAPAAEIEQLKAELAAAEQQLAALEQQAAAPVAVAAPAPAAEASAPAIDPLKKAKIELAMKKAALKKAEKAGAGADEISALQAELATAEQALAAAETQSSRPAPELVRVDKRPVDEATRTLKTELAFARADLRKLERDDSASAEALSAARARLDSAERRLQEHEAGH